MFSIFPHCADTNYTNCGSFLKQDPQFSIIRYLMCVQVLRRLLVWYFIKRFTKAFSISSSEMQVFICLEFWTTTMKKVYG